MPSFKRGGTVLLGALIGILVAGVIAFVYTGFLETLPQHRWALLHANGQYPLHVTALKQTETQSVRERPVMVFVHGLYSNSVIPAEVLSKWTAGLDHFTILCPDLLGHGNSPWPTTCEHTIERMVDTLYDTMEEMIAPETPVHVAGYCFGSIVALAFAHRLLRASSSRKWSLASYVAICGPYFRLEQSLRDAAERYRPAFYKEPFGPLALNAFHRCIYKQKWLLRDAIRSHARNKTKLVVSDAAIDALFNCSSKAMNDSLLAICNYRPQAAAHALRDAQVPSLLVCPAGDRLSAGVQNDFATDLGKQNCSLRWIDGGHLLLLRHDPQQLFAALDHFYTHGKFFL